MSSSHQSSKQREIPKSVLDFYVNQILDLASNFISCWYFVHREGNGVAHNLVKHQPVVDSLRVWDDDLPESIMDLDIMDLCNNFD